MKNKKICLVTGGAGFIGSNLVEKLVKKNFKVFVLDNLTTGRLKNIKNVKNKIVFIKSDIDSFRKLKKIDYVFHLAASVSVQESFKIKKKYYENNIYKTISFFNNLKTIPIKKFIYTASASCYGNNQKILNESSVINPISPYAESKWLAEQILFKLCKFYSIPFISFRLFNVYGKNFDFDSSYTGVIGKFIANYLNNKKLIIYGDGKQIRSFVHVDDVSNALILGANSKINYEIFNLGNPRYISIKQLARHISKNVKYMAKKKGDIKSSRCKVAKIKNYLKFSPQIRLKDGIKNLINYYK